MISIVIGIGVLLLLAILFVILRATSLVDIFRSADKRRVGFSNKVNAFLFPFFFVVGSIGFIWSYLVVEKDFLPEAVSEHGIKTDGLFWLTMIIITVAFVATHILLFIFPFTYQYKENNKASFYPDNNKLEMLWTVIPAIVLTVLIFTGWRVWSDITDDPPKGAEEIEVMAFQFGWLTRYPGPDKNLGAYDYRLTTAENEWGLDFSDKASFDDFTSSDRVLRIPKGRPVLFKIRSRDVIHSVFAPHFRLKMDAVPGMPTRFWFVPTKTTAEMRKELNNPEFNYEVACAEVCGRGHFGMRMIVEVMEDAEYNEWYASQKSHFSKHPSLLAKVPDNFKEEAKKLFPAEEAAAPSSETAVPADSSDSSSESVKTAAPATVKVDIKEGQKLFNTTCMACHQISDQRLVGPGLKNVDQKRSHDWLIKFIRNSQALIESGDKQAVEIYKEFNKMPMPSHDYTDEQISSIIAYIKSESSK
ncbi:MAG TPA: cytochrome c oxidase subunit II [Cytophagales bacterium]|nr:cytochrome c oxidase subunit II [Cytophagales bacterium]